MRVFPIIGGVLALALAAYVMTALPPRSIVIEAGPIGGTYFAHATAYAEVLEDHGFEVTLRSNPNSTKIIDNVNDPQSGVDIGFVAQPTDPALTPRVRVLAKVELQPLFLFYATALGEIVSPVNLRDRRIVLPMPASASAIAALDILAIYGVTPETATIEHLDLTEGARRLADGEFDAGFFMLASENPLISHLAADPDLAAFSYGDARSISINLDYLTPATLPAGAFDLSQALPPGDLELVGAEVQVITHEDLHPALALAVLDALTRRHSVATAVSDIGQYPDFSAARLQTLDAARDYALNGRPWTYQMFGSFWGSLFDEFFVLIFAVFLTVQGYRTVKYLLEGIEFVGLWAAGGVIDRHIRDHATGREPRMLGRLSLGLSARLIDRVSVANRTRSKLAMLRQLKQQGSKQDRPMP